MLNPFRSRYNILGLSIALYLLPIFLLSAYSTVIVPTGKAWSILGVGLPAAIAGILVLFIVMRQWEAQFRYASAPPSPVKENQSEEPPQEDLSKHFVAEIEQKDQEIINLQRQLEAYEEQLQAANRNFSLSKEASQEKMEQKTVLLDEYQKTIDEQRSMIIKQQDHMAALESHLHDLQNETQTPMNRPESKVTRYPPHEAIPMATHETVSQYTADNTQLKRCLDIAQKITGASHFSAGVSRFQDLSSNNSALDFRRLFDNLRSESGSTIFVYSKKEDKLLFTNQQAKELLGWPPEKVTQDFKELTATSTDTWREAINMLSPHHPTHLQLSIKNREGELLTLGCDLGMIPTGVFRQYVIGVLRRA